MDLKQDLSAYKKSVALFTAYRIGLFDKIKRNHGLNEQEIDKESWNPQKIRLLCMYLRDAGYLQEVKGVWVFSEGFPYEKSYQALNPLLEHEEALYRRWVTQNQLTQALMANKGERDFDRIGFSPDETETYNCLMYGEGLNPSAFWAARAFDTKAKSFLEYGRSGGAMLKKAGRYLNIEQADALPLGASISGEKRYNGVFIVNTVHYLKQGSLNEFLEQFAPYLTPDGKVFLTDLFYKPYSLFHSSLLLDWLTHGGLSYLMAEELSKELAESRSFSVWKHQYLPANGTDYFILQNHCILSKGG